MASIVLEESPGAVTNGADQDVELLAIANDTKDALLSAIGHDLWPPLSVIAGFAETLRRDANLMSKTDREAVKRIADNAERIELVLRRLLSVSEDLRVMRAARSSRVDLSLLIHDALRRSRPSTQCVHASLEGASVVGNSALLERLVDNLLMNAFVHTPPDSDVWIKVRSTKEAVLLVVEDSGRGLPVDLKIGLSLTTDPDGEPAPGSGLLLIQQIAALHGGRLRVGDRPGGGARFVVELPATA